jgi:hypothetical protein
LRIALTAHSCRDSRSLGNAKFPHCIPVKALAGAGAISKAEAFAPFLAGEPASDKRRG